ncbi:MAG TPA: zinc ribbon domain-containing protein [Verrucomicrobiae bacterium]|nr:zinc ribbon domain-containing protein [Verrucomicrobiae bacterium]
MPTYVFQCKNCADGFSVNVPMADRDKVVCPKCGSQELKQDYRSVFIGGKGGGSKSSCGTGKFT